MLRTAPPMYPIAVTDYKTLGMWSALWVCRFGEKKNHTKILSIRRTTVWNKEPTLGSCLSPKAYEQLKITSILGQRKNTVTHIRTPCSMNSKRNIEEFQKIVFKVAQCIFISMRWGLTLTTSACDRRASPSQRWKTHESTEYQANDSRSACDRHVI